MGLDRIFAESVRELPEGEKKCFQVIPPDTKCIKMPADHAARLSHVELGMGRIDIANCPREDDKVVINITVNARFSQFVLADSYLETCERKKYIIGKRKTEDGNGEFEDRIEVDISTEDVSSKNTDNFTGEKFATYVKAMMPSLTLCMKD
jgi:hypothetical protein